MNEMQKIMLKKIKKTLSDKNYIVLSKNYINENTPIEYKCNNNHVSTVLPSSIRNGINCKKCNYEYLHKRAYEKLIKNISSKEGKLISEFKDTSSKVTVQCKNNHIFDILPHTITWCRECTFIKIRENEIKKCRKLIEDLGYSMLTTLNEYEDCHSKIKIKCDKNHVYEIKRLEFKNGIYCRLCKIENEKQESYNKYKTYIEQKLQGICLTTYEDYDNNKTRSRFKWKCGICYYVQETIIGHLLRENVEHCKNCTQQIRHTIEDIHKIAKERGGECLSKEYKHDVPLQWKCKKGHVWNATFGSIKNSRTWCPTCGTFKRQKICQYIFEFMFNEKFPTSKPSWLISDKNKLLELDGYNEKLGIAFEHNGIQHYQYIEYIHRGNYDKFKRQLERDRIKYELCEKNHIKLIIIPYNIKIDDIQNFIIDDCEKKDIYIPNKKIIDNIVSKVD